MRILIFSANFGNGHNKVASYLSKKYEEEGHEVKILIPTRLENEVVAKTSENLFAFFSKNSKYKIIKNSYGLVFEVFSRYEKTIFSRFGEKKIQEAIGEYSPDLVVFTFPYQPGNIKTKSLMVITDYGFTRNWYNKNHSYIVGDEKIKNDLLKLDKNLKIYNVGIPIGEVAPREEVINKSSFDKNNPGCKFLINLGFLGICDFKNVTNLLNSLVKKKFFVIIICGRNNKLKNKFDLYVKKHNLFEVDVRGYVDDIKSLYKECFFMFTKAGGVTITEAINFEIPLIIDQDNSMLGQEKLNIDFIKKNNIGVILEDDIDANLDYMLDSYETMSENMRNIKEKYKNEKIKFDIEHL